MATRAPGLDGRDRGRRVPRVLFLSDYFAGRALYGALATYHAYLEFPVLLALIMAPRALTQPADPQDLALSPSSR